MKFERLDHQLFEQISTEDMNKINGGAAPEMFISLTDIRNTVIEPEQPSASAAFAPVDSGDTD
jgi:bacteriocin-like protein